MFVYGVRCSPADVAALTNSGCPVVADYYMDHGILVFPDYTRPTTLDARGRLTRSFWTNVELVATGSQCRNVDLFEDPYISDAEAAALDALRAVNPAAAPAWYYVPCVVETPSPTLIVTELAN
jgi:hypothetical protein